MRRLKMRLTILLGLILSTLLPALAMPMTAQGVVDVAIYTVENGQAAYDACYIIVGHSEIGCDENGDGKVTFAEIPYGTYTVSQTADLGPGRSVADFTITVTGTVNAEGYEGFTATIVGTGSSSPSGYSDVAIVTTENGQPAYDACYVIVDHSEVGCDENGDGKITFEAIPLGTHTVRQVADLGAGRSIPDFTITVTGAASSDGWERFPAVVTTSGTGRAVDVAIFTTDGNGRPAYDACYVLVGYSEEGCDENGDGRVMFDAIPVGTYTVHQTADLGPNRHVPDFTIEVTGNVSSAGYQAFRATLQHAPGGSTPGELIDIALITRDPDTGDLLTGTCYVLVDYSNEGCDENGDGQVTFDDVPAGTYTVHQTQAPAGYPAINDYDINVWPLGDLPDGRVLSLPLGFVVRQAPEQNAPGTLNVSVILIDYATGEKLSAGVCVELVGGSEVGCDDDLPDGQIDFLDVPPGGPYELRFSNLPAGWQVGTDGQPYSVSVNPQPGTPSNLFAFVLLVRPDSGSDTGSSGATTAELEWRGMVIGCDDPVACYGAEIVVTREGSPVDGCTITTDPNDTSHVHACSVDVPAGVMVDIHLDESTLAPGYTVVENDVRFDTTNVGRGASHDFIFDVVPAN